MFLLAPREQKREAASRNARSFSVREACRKSPRFRDESLPSLCDSKTAPMRTLFCFISPSAARAAHIRRGPHRDLRPKTRASASVRKRVRCRRSATSKNSTAAVRRSCG